MGIYNQQRSSAVYTLKFFTPRKASILFLNQSTEQNTSSQSQISTNLNTTLKNQQNVCTNFLSSRIMYVITKIKKQKNYSVNTNCLI